MQNFIRIRTKNGVTNYNTDYYGLKKAEYSNEEYSNEKYELFIKSEIPKVISVISKEAFEVIEGNKRFVF